MAGCVDGSRMPAYTVRYSFEQPFHTSARRAFAWCTDFRTDDHARMGETGRRTISRLTEDTLLLTDVFPGPRGGSVTKVKLVRLDPAGLSWTNTHLSGPARHSQFLYRIVPEGRDRSHLVFSGFQVGRAPRRPTRAQLRALAQRLQREDSLAWRQLARALDSELARGRGVPDQGRTDPVGPRAQVRNPNPPGTSGPSPMFSGAHLLLFSTDPEADRRFFRDVLRFPWVDAGAAWPIYALPPTELAVHPSEENGTHELFLTCHDLRATLRQLRLGKVRCSAPVERPWGTLVHITLPGGSRLAIYQPKHPLAHG